MEKQETKSKWDDLAREIGAELSPEAEQRAETHAVAAESGGISASASPPAVRPPLPKKPAADWVGLSSELGLPPLEEEPQPTETPLEKPLRPVEPPPDQSRESHTRKSHTSESHSREPQQREPQQRESRPRERSDRDSRSRGRRGRGGGRRGERQDDEGDSGESSRHQREADHRRRDRPQGRRGSHEQPRSHDESRHETSEPRREPKPREFDSASFDEPVEERPTVAETPPPPFAPEPPAKSPAVSLWHKIFGAPAEPPSTVADTQAEEASEFGTAQQRFESPDVFHGSEIRSFSGEDVPTADFVDEGSIESTPADEEGESIELKRGRSRRRRRGGRGRKPGRGPRDAHPAEPRVHESGGDDQLNAEFDDLEDDDGDLADEDHFDAARPGTGDSDLEDSEREHGSSHSRSLSATQRAIPTWDDAIGFIVESNMQSRSQRRPPSRSDSRGNASRGRPRGRRK